MPSDKKLLFVISFILLTGMINPGISISGSSQHGRQVKNRSKQTDSLQILDSLVNEYRISNNRISISYARKAVGLAGRINSPELLVKAYILMGMSFTPSEKDSSYIYYNKALNLAIEENLERQKSGILFNIALLYNDACNNKTALVFLDSALRIAELNHDYQYISNIYLVLGNVKYEMKDVSGARLMYQKGYRIAKANSLYRQMGVALGNLASYEKNPRSAFNMQKEALGMLEYCKGAEQEKANILVNIGYDHANPDSAIYYYKSALLLVKNCNLPEIEMGTYNNMAYSYLEKGDIKFARSCLIDHAIPVALKGNNQDWLSTLYDSYADILMESGEYKEAATYQKKALESRTEADLKAASGQVRLLAALFDMKSKDRELFIQHIQLQQIKLWLIIAVLVILIILSGIIWLAQRNRMKLQRQNIVAARRIIGMEEDQKGRTARELHDITGQFVLSITDQIAKIDFPDPDIKNQLIEKIEDTRQSLRVLSHKMNKVMIEQSSFEELVFGLCEDIHKLTGLQIDLELPEEQRVFSQEIVLHSFRIIQELLMNAGKYVKEGQVRIRVKVIKNLLQISYIDNGPGFDPAMVKGKGMGIMNIYERARLLNGKVNLSSLPGSGSSWEIIIPLSIKQA